MRACFGYGGDRRHHAPDRKRAEHGGMAPPDRDAAPAIIRRMESRIRAL